MDTLSIPTQQHELHGKWNLYYHLPNDKNWDLSSYKPIMEEIDTVEKLIALNENIPENIVKHCMLFVMRSGITPMWEDSENRNGGCFSFKVANKQVHTVWKTLFYALCGETLSNEAKYSAYFNGITISPKKNFCIVKVWLKNCLVQDPNILIPIPNLSKQGCLFKKHAPEF
jgi:translation initiation factor 4E